MWSILWYCGMSGNNESETQYLAILCYHNTPIPLRYSVYHNCHNASVRTGVQVPFEMHDSQWWESLWSPYHPILHLKLKQNTCTDWCIMRIVINRIGIKTVVLMTLIEVSKATHNTTTVSADFYWLQISTNTNLLSNCLTVMTVVKFGFHSSIIIQWFMNNSTRCKTRVSTKYCSYFTAITTFSTS